MVAKISTPHRIQDALNYNEQKVKKGTAECIHAGNYLKEGKDMNFYQKLQGFENRNGLNDRATTKTLHISLNFDPSEKLSKEKTIEIANTYMEKIGFDEQPYLVYMHKDAGHPHVHIVTTTIKEDGRRINTHNIGRNQSEKARKEVEQLYNLVKAERQMQLLKETIRPIHLQKLIYGKDETKRSISNLVNAVLSKYKFTSLPELNAVLRQYNVIADRGKEDGRIFRHGGLNYQALDENGNKIGVPIKASSVSTKPTLKKLEERFEKNKSLREPFKNSLKEKIELALSKNPGSLKELNNLLAKEQINLVLRQSAEGRVFGVTYVDNKTYCVFNGSDLGKAYSAAALQQTILKSTPTMLENKEVKYGPTEKIITTEKSKLKEKELRTEIQQPEQSIMEQLLNAEQSGSNTPSQLLKKKRKRKRKQLGL